jgi:hypothetical protein
MYNLFALEFPEESLINVSYKNTTKIGTLQRGYKNITVQYLERKIHGHDHNIPYGNHIYIYCTSVYEHHYKIFYIKIAIFLLFQLFDY